MARAYYSTVFDQSADRVWAAVRDFGNYRLWVDEVDESAIEESRPGDAVGAIRRIRMGDTLIRQRLLAHSDLDRCYSYEFCGAPRFPVTNYLATIRVTPVTDGERAFVEWWASFDAAAAEHDHWTSFFARSFGGWLGALRRRLAAPG